ncbi:MAG: protease modulator HflC, partial [Methyloceanibacter sp.]
YRIVDPLLFFQTLRDERIASARIGAVLEASLRRVLGGSSFTAVVRDKRESLMKTIAGQVNQEATPFGVTIVDVRIKRVDLPEANMQAIYRRMQTERQREAAEFRAEGEGAARRIRATADREVTVIKAEATGESERIRGAGDAERNRIFAEAFGQDPDFFAFYRSMQAYEGSLRPGDTRMLLSPNSQFFRYFNNAFGKAVQDVGPASSGPSAAPQAPSGGTGGAEQGGPEDSAALPEPDTAGGGAAPSAPETP